MSIATTKNFPRPEHLAVHGARIAYDDEGKGPAILFVHGFMLDRTIWHAQVAGLDGWRRIAPDLRGMGLSEAVDGRYSMDIYADDLAALLDALEVERTVICGSSMGAYVSFEFLRRHFDRVAALVVMDARGEADTPRRKAARNDMIARVRSGDTRSLVEELVPEFLAEQTPTDVRRQLEEMMCRAPAAGIVGALEAMRDRHDHTPLLASTVNLPTLLLIGADDVRTPRASMQAMADRIPDATFDVIVGAGHLPPIEQPVHTTTRLRRFLDGLEFGTDLTARDPGARQVLDAGARLAERA